MTLTNGSGNIVAQYSYDAWGNILSQAGSIASDNPYRYAGIDMMKLQDYTT